MVLAMLLNELRFYYFFFDPFLPPVLPASFCFSALVVTFDVISSTGASTDTCLLRSCKSSSVVKLLLRKRISFT